MMTATLAPAAPPVPGIDAATAWRGSRRVLGGFSLRVAAGDHTAILGRTAPGNPLWCNSSRARCIRRRARTTALRLFGRERRDEPCAGLDRVSRRPFLDRWRVLARDGATLLLVILHVAKVLPGIGPVLLLREGRVVGHGDRSATLPASAFGALFRAPIEVQQRGAW